VAQSTLYNFDYVLKNQVTVKSHANFSNLSGGVVKPGQR